MMFPKRWWFFANMVLISACLGIIVMPGLGSCDEAGDLKTAADRSALLQLNEQGRITVRALRAYGRLPDRYVQLGQHLRQEHGLDLLGADLEQIRSWIAQAEQGDVALAAVQDQLVELAEYLAGGQYLDHVTNPQQVVLGTRDAVVRDEGSRLVSTSREAVAEPFSGVVVMEENEVDQIVSRHWREGVLDQLMEVGGALPTLGEPEMLTDFPELPSNDPCNQESWTLPVAMWATTHFTSVHGQTIPEPAVMAGIPAEPTPESMEDYQASLLRVIAGMRLICGVPDQGEPAKAFDVLWGPYVQQPSTEAHIYFTRLNDLLEDYFLELAHIEGDLEAARETWRLAANAAVFQDEQSVRDLLDVGFIIARRLTQSKEKAVEVIARIIALGNPPNPLQAQCRARKRHQDALAEVTGDETKSGRWVLSEVEFDDHLTGGQDLQPEETSVLAERPKQGFYQYDYLVSWSHPPAILRKGEDLVLQGLTTRTSLDEYPFTCTLGVPRVLDKPSGLSRCYNVAFRQEKDFFFALEGEIRTEGDPRTPQLRVVLEPFAGTRVDEFLDYDQSTAGWVGKREYVYAWDADGRMTPMELSGTPDAPDAPPGPEDAVPAPETPPAMTAEEVAEAIEHHAANIAFIRRNLERAREELAREKDPQRVAPLDDEIVSHLSNIQIEEDRITSLRLGRTIRTRTLWEERAKQRFLERIEREVDALAQESKLVKGLPVMAQNRFEGGAEARSQMFGDISEIYQADLPLEQRIARLTALRSTAHQANIAEQQEARSRMITAENRLWYAEKVQTASKFSLLVGSLFVPGGAYVTMTYGMGTGYVEGGPAKALENAVRIIDPIDVAWAAYDGYYAQEINPLTGKPEYGGWRGAAENAAITYVMNKAFEKIGQRVQGGADAGQQTTTGARKGAVDYASRPRGEEPKFDAFIDNADRMRMQARQIDAVYVKEAPKRPDGSIDMANPDYLAVRDKYSSQRKALEDQFGVIARREHLKQDLADCTRKHEGRISAEARNPDGSVNQDHPAYKQVKQEWEAEVAGLRRKHNEGFEQRMAEQKEFIEKNGLKKTIDLSGGEPKSIMSDIDLTARDMASGEKFIQGMQNKGYQVLDYHDRWIIPAADTVVWKPQARPELAGGSAHSASVHLGAVRGSDKFPTEGGVHYTTKGAAGTEDPVGAVIANLKKATESGIGGNQPPDYHVIGKSVDKAIGIANEHGARIDDPAFSRKAQGVREHKIPEEAGITTFGNPDRIKQQESEQFLGQARKHMVEAMATGEKASMEANAKRIQAIRQAEAAGNREEANRLRAELVRARITNEAAMQSLAAQDPAFIRRVHNAINSVPPQAMPPDSSRRLGYGALLKKMGVTADPERSPAPQQSPVIQAATQVLGKQILPAISARGASGDYFAALNHAFQQAESSPLQASRAAQAISGYAMSKVAADLLAVAGKTTERTTTSTESSSIVIPKLDNEELRSVTTAWVFLRIPITKIERGPLGFSNENRKEVEISPRVALSGEPLTWNDASFALNVMFGYADRQSTRYADEQAMRDRSSYWTKAQVNAVFSGDGDRLDRLIFSEIDHSDRSESHHSMELHDIPRTETKVFPGTKPLTVITYALTGPDVRDHLKEYAYGSEHNWPEGRWKHELGHIRWEASENGPRALVILSPSSLEELDASQKSAVQAWIDEQRGWEIVRN